MSCVPADCKLVKFWFWFQADSRPWSPEVSNSNSWYELNTSSSFLCVCLWICDVWRTTWTNASLNRHSRISSLLSAELSEESKSGLLPLQQEAGSSTATGKRKREEEGISISEQHGEASVSLQHVRFFCFKKIPVFHVLSEIITVHISRQTSFSSL